MQKKSTLMYATLAFMIASNTALAQQVITGKVTDGKQPIAGATVIIPGSKVGTSTDKDGNFTITAPKNNGQLEVKFIGHATQIVLFNNDSPIQTVVLQPNDGESLEEIIIVGKSIIDIAEGRRTPIAVSTIKQQEIEEKVGGQDITSTLANTPSVYIGGQAKGFGESSMTTRGFDQSNTAFLLNGQPINGMDNGRVFWSNWNGLSDIASLVQIQRGLGSSKLAISSVGGTTNFVTKSTDMKEGGFLRNTIGNDMYRKSTIAYNTGLMKNGFAVSAMFTDWSGNGYMNQTQGAGQNYFLSIGYKVNDNHNLNLMITGAPQWHNQGFTGRLSKFLENGRRYNDNIRTYNGVEMNPRKNYYHKPVANLNWDWKIDEKSTLGTVVYASIAKGGGTSKYDDASAAKLPFLSASVNNHQWFGIVSNYQRELSKNLSFNAGFDLRDYKGTHFREVSDLLGSPSIAYYGSVNDPGLHTTSTVYSTNPWKAFSNYAKNKEERLGWDYNQYIRYAGLFGQIEYAKNGFTTFFQGSVSEQQNSRTDYFQYTSGNQKSEKINNFGYNVKGGASYSLGAHTVFANAGFYSRQPFQNNIFAFNSNLLNPQAKNEDILGLEAGYKYESKYLDVSVNAYRTTWANRVTGSSTTAKAADVKTYGADKLTVGDFIYSTNYGVKQDHKGVELEFVTKPFSFVQVKGFGSLGDWVYKGSTTTVLRNENREVLGTKERDITGVKVGDAAQTSYGAGVKFFIINGLSADADYRRYERLYGALPSDAATLKLPDYDLVDAGISYKLTITEKNTISFRFNINNLLNTFYISDATSNDADKVDSQYWKGINTSNFVLIGQGRTWNGSVKFTF